MINRNNENIKKHLTKPILETSSKRHKLPHTIDNFIHSFAPQLIETTNPAISEIVQYKNRLSLKLYIYDTSYTKCYKSFWNWTYKWRNNSCAQLESTGASKPRVHARRNESAGRSPRVISFCRSRCTSSRHLQKQYVAFIPTCLPGKHAGLTRFSNVRSQVSIGRTSVSRSSNPFFTNHIATVIVAMH